MGSRQPTTGMDDVERQTPHPHGDTEILNQKANDDVRDCRIICIGVIVSAAITTCILVPVEHFQVDTHYYITINSVSDLITPAAKGLSFNLTLGVASRSHGSKACIRPGTFAEVSYRGVQLATSEAEVGRLCAGPRKSAEQRVVAGVTGVPVGQVLDGLTSDMKQGAAAVFDVTLHLPPGSYGVGGGGEVWLSECKGGRVGAAGVWCDAPSQEPTL